METTSENANDYENQKSVSDYGEYTGKLCPISSRVCSLACAWWDAYAEHCAILTAARSLAALARRK